MTEASAATEVRKPGAEPRRVVLADAISPAGVELLAGEERLSVDDLAGEPREALKEALPGAAALIVRSSTTVDADLLDAGDALQVVGRAGVGVDNIDMEEATRRGIAVLNAPGGNTLSTAELAFGLILSAVRHIPRADRHVREGGWDRAAFRGVQLHGRRLGVVGAGRIGAEVLARGRAFGMDVVAHDPYLPRERADDLGVELLDLAELLATCDVVTLHAPLTDDTRGLIGADELALMSDDAYLVNAARGGLVDEEALARALEAGGLAGAALDVYGEEPPPEDHVLRDAPNLVMTPHLGAATDEAKREVAVEIATSVRSALLDGDLHAALNAPRIEPSEKPRVEPLLDLGRRLGTLLSVLSAGNIGELRVRYGGTHGEILRPLAATAAEGFLQPTTDRPLNRVNALYLAKERGVEVTRTRTREVADYANYVELTAVGTETEATVGGALLGDAHPRVVRIGDFHVNIVPRRAVLVIRNRDVPGVIGEVGSRLGDAGVNIAEYHQARRDVGGDALAVVTVDGTVPDEVLAAIRDLDDVASVRQVDFED